MKSPHLHQRELFDQQEPLRTESKPSPRAVDTVQHVLQEAFDVLQGPEARERAAALAHFIEKNMQELERILQRIANGLAKDDKQLEEAWVLLGEHALMYREFAKRLVGLGLENVKERFDDRARTLIDELLLHYVQYQEMEDCFQRVEARTAHATQETAAQMDFTSKEQLERLEAEMNTLSGMRLLQRAVAVRLTTEVEERRYWLREKNEDKAPSESHTRATAPWAYGGPQHCAFIDAVRRPSFLHVIEQVLKEVLMRKHPFEAAKAAIAKEHREALRGLLDRSERTA